jgi:hypothetical protein
VKKVVFTFIWLAAAAGWAQSTERVPVVIELFTSEGCSSCPPADQLLAEFDHAQPVPGVQLIVLSEHVDYWNSLGWIDPYSAHEFSERQLRYTQALHVPDAYTPQAVVDGRFEAVGNNAPKLQAAIQQARREKKLPLRFAAKRSEKTIHVELQTEQGWPPGAEVFFAIAEDRVESKVSAGENGGHMLKHTGVVRSLTKASMAAGGEIAMDLKTNGHWGEHLRVVALVSSSRDGGKILGAAMTTL